MLNISAIAVFPGSDPHIPLIVRFLQANTLNKVLWVYLYLRSPAVTLTCLGRLGTSDRYPHIKWGVKARLKAQS